MKLCHSPGGLTYLLGEVEHTARQLLKGNAEDD